MKFNNPTSDTLVIKTIRDFLTVILETDCYGDPRYAHEYEGLVYELIGLSPLPTSLAYMTNFITNKWSDGTLDLDRLAILARFTNKIDRLKQGM